MRNNGPTAHYSCPNCDRPTLERANDEIVKWRCAVCGERVEEVLIP